MSAEGAAHFCFFLGGHDLEMLTIRDLLAAEAVEFHDKALRWGAKASDYRDEIHAALAAAKTPVLVELSNDLGLGAAVAIVDHHGERAGADRPCSLEQVFALLCLPPERWTRWFALVAANDKGYVPAMRRIGATAAEMCAVCAAEWKAQGITEEEGASAQAAAGQLEQLHAGELTVARLPHNRTRPLTDSLEPALGGPGYRHLLVLSPGEVNAFGSGHWITTLDAAFPGGWRGGDLPVRGFWGHGAIAPEAVYAWARRHPPSPSDTDGN